MAKKFALVFGWIFLVIGVLGFFGNPIVGYNSLFHTDAAHNIVHLILGAVLLWVAYGAAQKSALILKIVGVVYLLAAIAGFLSAGTVLGLFEVNGADNWLHLVFAALLLWGGWSKDSSPAQGQTM